MEVELQSTFNFHIYEAPNMHLLLAMHNMIAALEALQNRFVVKLYLHLGLWSLLEEHKVKLVHASLSQEDVVVAEADTLWPSVYKLTIPLYHLLIDEATVPDKLSNTIEGAQAFVDELLLIYKCLIQLYRTLISLSL